MFGSDPMTLSHRNGRHSTTWLPLQPTGAAVEPLDRPALQSTGGRNGFLAVDPETGTTGGPADPAVANPPVRRRFVVGGDGAPHGVRSPDRRVWRVASCQ
ncbi:hypothetical protein GCM10027184_03980 [Saccharothrix stipae]